MPSDEQLNIIINGVDKASSAMDQVESSLSHIEKASNNASQGFNLMQGASKALSGVLTGVLVSGIAIAGTAIAGLGTASIDYAGQFNQAQREIQGQLGVTADVAEELANVSETVFANNFADNIGEAKDAVVLFQQQLSKVSDVSNDVLGAVAEDAFKIRDAFGAEIPETVNAVTALVKNFGITGEEATSIIASGFQAGLNSSNDFLESITEYSNQFAQGGASVDEFFNIMAGGLETGILGTDKAADLFKEFVVRIQDGSTLTSDSLEMIGINADDMLTKLANGTIKPIDAFDGILEALNKTDNQAIQMQAGVGLLGTQFEDLTASTVLALDASSDVWDRQGKALDDINVRYESFGALAQGAYREVLVALRPLSDQVLDLASEYLPVLIEALTGFINQVVAFASDPIVQDYFADIGERVLMFAQVFQEQVLPVIETTWNTIVNDILPLILPIIEQIIAIIGTVAPAFAVAFSLVAISINHAISIIQFLLTTLQGALQIINGLLTGDLGLIMEGVKTIFSGVASFVSDTWNNITNTIRTAVESAKQFIQSLIDKINAIPDLPSLPNVRNVQLPKFNLPKFASGGDFVTNGPQAIIVGDNPGGKERVQVTPLSSTNVNGPKESKGDIINISFNLPNSPVMMNAKSIAEFVKQAKPEILKTLNI